MQIAEQIKRDVVTAMKAGDRDRAGALRLVLSELQKAEKEGTGDELAVLRRERKRRRESEEAYRAAGRAELAAAEAFEAQVIETYLPAELSDAELDALVERRDRRDRSPGPARHGQGDQARHGSRRRPRRRAAGLDQGEGSTLELMARRQLELSNEVAAELAGSQDAILQGARGAPRRAGIFLRGNVVTLDGDAEAVQAARPSCASCPRSSSAGTTSARRRSSRSRACSTSPSRPSAVLEDVVWRHRNLKVAPKSVNQKSYVDAIRRSTITFGVGPAGTGKTFLAIAMATAALSRREVNRIILTRPAVEAGERLGFLPGDLMAKVDPYLRPLFDALHDMMDAERVAAHLERGVIEVAPLAFMRGRTLNDSFVILDEAQNTTPEQMKMFLTRLGFGSKMVVTGDITQVDLPRDQQSGLIVVTTSSSGVDGLEFVRFGGEDVVRHKLVQRIVAAYDEHSKRAAPELRSAEPRRRGRVSCSRSR